MRKVFDGRPKADALAMRCKRDGIDPASLVEVIIPQRGGQYFVRCFGLATMTTEFDGTARQVPAYSVYMTRRDGRVSDAWGHKFVAREVEVLP